MIPERDTAEWNSLVERLTGTMLVQYPGPVSREVAEFFELSAEDALAGIERTWDESKGRSFGTYAWQKLKWVWHDEMRKVRVQRGELDRGHREVERSGHPGRLGKTGRPVGLSRNLPNDVPVGLRGKAPAGIRWVNSRPYTVAMKDEVRKQIGPVIVNGFFGTTPYQDLTESEARVCGYHVFGASYPMARDMWDHEDCDGLLFMIGGSLVWKTDGTGHLQRLTHREVGEMMGASRSGRPYDPKAVAQILSDAARKLGCPPDKVTYVVYQGILQTRIRRRIEADAQGL